MSLGTSEASAVEPKTVALPSLFAHRQFKVVGAQRVLGLGAGEPDRDAVSATFVPSSVPSVDHE